MTPWHDSPDILQQMACSDVFSVSQQYSTVSVLPWSRKFTRCVSLCSQKSVTVFFFTDGISLNAFAVWCDGCFHIVDAFFGFRCCAMNPCFILCNCVLQELLFLLIVMWQMNERALNNKLSDKHEGAFVPTVLALFCNWGGCGQCSAHYPVKCPALGQFHLV